MKREAIVFGVVVKRFSYESDAELENVVQAFQDEPVGAHLVKGVEVLRGDE